MIPFAVTMLSLMCIAKHYLHVHVGTKMQFSVQFPFAVSVSEMHDEKMYKIFIGSRMLKKFILIPYTYFCSI